jgi:hypothetical protein
MIEKEAVKKNKEALISKNLKNNCSIIDKMLSKKLNTAKMLIQEFQED